MGSLARQRARQRFQEALRQQLSDTQTVSGYRSVYADAIDELLGIAVDASEINAAAHRLATDPDDIDGLGEAVPAQQ